MKTQQEKIKKFDKQLNKHIQKQDLVTIYRTETEEEANILGFILAMSKDFLLIQVEEEFYLNGYAIIRKDRFDSIRVSKVEKFLKKILKKAGILKKDLGLKKQPALTSWETIFSDLKKLDYYAIVECEDLPEPTFTIGEIAKVAKKSVGIRYFNPEGVIDQKPTKVKYEDITLVKFDDRYTKMYRKYLREAK